MLDIQAQTKSATASESAEKKVKGKWGGPRPNSGRPRKMDEQAIIEKLKPMETLAFKKLQEKISEGDMNAIKLFYAYYIGMPTQRVENKIEGQLNQVSVEVVRPQLEEVSAN